MTIVNYLQHHQKLHIGEGLSDIIVDDPVAFVSFVEKTKYYIAEILWWEHIKISDRNLSIGHGGPIDPQNKLFFYSETDLSTTFSKESSSPEINAYISKIKLSQ